MAAPNYVARIEIAISVFTPRQAIGKADHLAGRRNEIGKVIAATFSPGAHAVIYGDRGVGKTSLANCVAEQMSAAFSGQIHSPLVVPPVNCDSSDTFSAVWQKVFSKIEITRSTNGMGFRPEDQEEKATAADEFPETATPHDVQATLKRCDSGAGVVVMLDEFDRLPTSEATRLMADTIKALSDQDIRATVIVIGVGESVSALIEEHESIARHIVEIPVPRLMRDEQRKVIADRLPLIGLTINEQMMAVIVSLSKGLPFYLHLLGQKASIAALMDQSDEITSVHIGSAMRASIDESRQSLRDLYYKATRSPQPTAKHRHTLAACALARCDEFGYFTPTDVAAPYSRIIGEQRKPGSFLNRLKALTEENRGSVLVASGKKHDVRFRFRDPLMEPFVVMKSIDEKLLSVDDIVL